MYLAVAILLIAILSGLGLLHLYWGLGGRAFFDGTIPTDDGRPLFVPGPGATLIAACALAAAAVLAAWRAGLVDVGGAEWGSRVGIGLVAFAFGVRAVGDFRYVGFFKRVRGTVFARRDSLLYSPLCAVIVVLASGLAIASP